MQEMQEYVTYNQEENYSIEIGTKKKKVIRLVDKDIKTDIISELHKFKKIKETWRELRAKWKISQMIQKTWK